MSETKIICIGSKPISAYLQAVYIAQQNGAKEIRLLARGRLILTAIDVASILQRNGGKVNNVEIGSIKKLNYPGYASTIEINIEI